MKRLLTFESFVPKNIDQRMVVLQTVAAKQLSDYNLFVDEFKTNLDAIQGLKVTDVKEQLFIDLLQHLTIKLDQDKYPFRIFLFNIKDQCMFVYDWKNDTFWYQHSSVGSPFESKFNMNYQACQQFITIQVEQHFKFRPSITTRRTI